MATLAAVLAEFDRHLSAARRPSSPPRQAPTGKATLLRGTPTMTDTPSETLGVDEAAALVAEARREVAQS
ncbi:hypothetical protein ABTJ25_19955, partial [Acinetobacter baumannii]